MKVILSLAAPRMKLEDVGKSEIRRSNEDKHCTIHLPDEPEGKFREAERRRVVPRTGRRLAEGVSVQWL